MTFAQVIVSQPQFVEITTLISILLQLSLMVAQNCFKISVNQVFFGNIKLPLRISQNKLNSDF